MLKYRYHMYRSLSRFLWSYSNPADFTHEINLGLSLFQFCIFHIFILFIVSYFPCTCIEFAFSVRKI